MDIHPILPVLNPENIHPANLHQRLTHVEKTGEVDHCPEIQEMIDFLIAKEARQLEEKHLAAEREREAQENLRKEQLEQEQEKQRQRQYKKRKQELQEIEQAGQVILSLSIVFSQELDTKDKSFAESFHLITECSLALNKFVQILLTHIQRWESELSAQDPQYELSIYNLRQGTDYSQRYLAHHLKPQTFQHELQTTLVPDRYVRRILHYLGNLPSLADEIVLRLKTILNQEIEQLENTSLETPEEQE
jgi:hypothetical protein